MFGATLGLDLMLFIFPPDLFCRNMHLACTYVFSCGMGFKMDASLPNDASFFYMLYM